jgi:hypothetical protein
VLPPPWKRRLLVCLLTAGSSLGLRIVAPAQSATPAELLLKVVSVKYQPDEEKVEYTLANDDAQSSVTAYVIEISAVIHRQYDTLIQGPTRHVRDLLPLELAHQCRDAATSADDDDDNPWREVKIPPGIIPPGKERTDSLDSSILLPDSLLEAARVELNARVTGVIWSDGRIEATTGIEDMWHVRDGWIEAAREERDVLAVLRAHPDDGDHQHRINEAIAGLKSLMEGYPRQVPVPEDEPPNRTMYVGEPGLESSTMRDLEYAAYQANPIARITSDIEIEECVHERRIELQEPAMAGPRRQSLGDPISKLETNSAQAVRGYSF